MWCEMAYMGDRFMDDRYMGDRFREERFELPSMHEVCFSTASHLMFVWFWDLFSVFLVLFICWLLLMLSSSSGIGCWGGVLMVVVKMCTSGSGVSHLCLVVFLVCVAGVLWAL